MASSFMVVGGAGTQAAGRFPASRVGRPYSLPDIRSRGHPFSAQPTPSRCLSAAYPEPERSLIALLKDTLSLFLKLISVISLDEDQMPHDLQPGDYAYRKRQNLKDYLQPGEKDPFQVLLTSLCTAKLKGIDFWINFHSQRAPALEWPIERMADLENHLKTMLKQRRNYTHTRARRRRHQK